MLKFLMDLEKVRARPIHNSKSSIHTSKISKIVQEDLRIADAPQSRHSMSFPAARFRAWDLNQAEDDLRVLRHEHHDSLRDLNAFKEQNPQSGVGRRCEPMGGRGACLSVPPHCLVPSQTLTCRKIVHHLW